MEFAEIVEFILGLIAGSFLTLSVQSFKNHIKNKNVDKSKNRTDQSHSTVIGDQVGRDKKS